jgi:hypothetical protein
MTERPLFLEQSNQYADQSLIQFDVKDCVIAGVLLSGNMNCGHYHLPGKFNFEETYFFWLAVCFNIAKFY